MTTDHVTSRRQRAAAAWGLADEIVLVGAGEILLRPGFADQTLPFRAHAEHFYLTDRDRPGAVLAFDPREGWTDFVPQVTEEDRVWTGEVENVGVPVEGLGPWLAARSGRPVAALGCEVPGVAADPALTAELRERLLAVRRPKGPEELERIRRACAATAAGFARAVATIRPGATERAIQIEMEADFFRRGAEATAYDSIVGSGPNSAVFHISPTDRAVAEGEMVLIDAGAQVAGYAADVTRTYPVSGHFGAEQRALYEIVLEAQKAAVAKCRPGKEYREIHLECAVDMTRGLVDFGLLRGNPQSLVDQDAHALFFPHGVGHLVGLGVRDASGYLPGRPRSTRPGLKYLRMDLPLGEGYVTTIEPGLYLVPALLRNRDNRERYRQEVNWDLADRLVGLGGVRIEDDVLVTDGEPDVLTRAIPKELGEVERG
ncbi:MAG TPA: aminopeptidase P N-terminal domain-containing protein [Thermoanaerobaculia bacterium]|nr:aminopeptidase P N-terminal domain-containing protein [Thermoanaerobaculia bacterium]